MSLRVTALSGVLAVGVTGQKRAGKDTIADRLVKNWGFVKIELPGPLVEELMILNPWCEIEPSRARLEELPRFMRFADMVSEFGMDKAKELSPDVRAYQQRYGTDIIRERVDGDRLVRLAVERMRALVDQTGQRLFVLPNVRVANETYICNTVIRVKRVGCEISAADHSIEQAIDGLPVGYTLHNDRDRFGLWTQVDQLAKTHLHDWLDALGLPHPAGEPLGIIHPPAYTWPQFVPKPQPATT